MMLIFENVEKKYSLYAGKIVNITEKNNIISLALSDADGEKTFVFVNGAKRKMSDRIKKVKLKKGAYITILSKEFQGKEYAIDFRFNGIWHYLDGDKNYYYIVGKVNFINYTCNSTQFKFATKNENGFEKISVTWFKNELNIENFKRRALLKQGDYLMCKCSGKKGKYNDTTTFTAFSVLKVF